MKEKKNWSFIGQIKDMSITKFRVVLQINSTLNWGSTGRIAEEIGQMIIANGGESYIAYGRYGNHSQSRVIRIGNKWNVYLHVLQTRLFDRHGLVSKKATHLLIKHIEEIKPDIIHLHNIHGYYLNYPILFDYLAYSKIPIVWTLHDCWPFTGHCSHFSYVKCERWKIACNNCIQKNDYPSSFLFDNSKDNYYKKMASFTSIENMTVVPVSKWLRSLVTESFLKKYPINVIHNGIDINVFHPLDSSQLFYTSNNKFVILGVASIWEKRKGLDDFIQLQKLLSQDYSIILIGLTKAQIKQLPQYIIGIERTNSVQELAAYYSSADVFFNPTWEDNFPTTNLEALACGTPVITYKTGGSPEAIDENTGFVIEQGNLNEAIRAMEQIKSVGKGAYTQACRERAVKYFNKKDRYADYLQLYNEILNK